MKNLVKKIRQERGLTQEKLSKMVNISRVHLAEIENGNAVPSIVIAQKIASSLNHKIDDIFLP